MAALTTCLKHSSFPSGRLILAKGNERVLSPPNSSKLVRPWLGRAAASAARPHWRRVGLGHHALDDDVARQYPGTGAPQQVRGCLAQELAETALLLLVEPRWHLGIPRRHG